MDIKAGEYVRTENGDIYKISYYSLEEKRYISVTEEDWYPVYESEIVKHSDFIEELIEIGDYVNGHKVELIWEDADNYRFGGCDYMFQITGKDIKSIVTKEQFENIKYNII